MTLAWSLHLIKALSYAKYGVKDFELLFISVYPCLWLWVFGRSIVKYPWCPKYLKASINRSCIDFALEWGLIWCKKLGWRLGITFCVFVPMILGIWALFPQIFFYIPTTLKQDNWSLKCPLQLIDKKKLISSKPLCLTWSHNGGFIIIC